MIALKIKDKQTGLISNPVNIMDLIEGQYIEFEFPDDTSLPYKDFLFFREDFEVILEGEI